ncbi:MAG: orotidine-5'-phosphate decarboxylase [Actinomycetota bacterium]
MSNPLIVALDVPSIEEASVLAKKIGDAAGAFKIGLELFCAHGPDAVRSIDSHVFLDLKLNDIPTTVERAIKALHSLRPFMLTVHALGGRAMLQAAANAKPEGCLLVAVTALTSLDDASLFELGLPPAAEAVPALAALAHESGCDGVVCAPGDLTVVREMLPPPFVLVTPGIRPEGADHNDQARASTPSQALRSGADYLVVGRPVTRAPNPREAALQILEIR